MIYSTFNYDTRKWTFFEAPGVPPATGSFRMPGSAMVPESLLARLPAGARQVGEGDLPKGIICTTDSSLAGLSSTDGAGGGGWGLAKLGAAVAAGFYLGRRLR